MASVYADRASMPRLIDLANENNRRFWSRAFGIPEQDLVLAVHTTGPQPFAVAHLLKIVPNLDEARS